MTQLSMKQKQIHRDREQTWLPRGSGERWTWNLGLVDANDYM